MDDHTVYCWGRADYGIGLGATVKGRSEPTQVPDLTNVVQLEGSANYTCVRLEDGMVKCWGFVPQPHWEDPEVDEHDDISIPPSPWTVPNIENALDIALGPDHMCVTLADERVLCWGENGYGQLGTPPAEPRFSKVPLLIDGLEDVVDLGLGNESACAVKSDQTIWCWGDNSIGQLGFESVWKEWGTPQQAQVPTGAVKVEMNGDTGCAISDSGKLVCWGEDIDLPVSTGFPLEWRDPSMYWYEDDVERLVNVTDVSVDNGASCVIAGGTVRCCDMPEGGNCRSMTGVKGASQVSLRGARGCALASGKVYCWTEVHVNSEVRAATRVRKLKPVVELSQGPNGFCARHKNGTVSCWETSFDDHEQLVLGQPTPLKGAEDTVQFVRNDDYTCAVHKDGTVSCWGKLADDIESETPTLIEGLEHVVQVELGKAFACARLDDGTVKCWGEGYSGQLGISRRYRPVELNWKEKLTRDLAPLDPSTGSYLSNSADLQSAPFRKATNKLLP